MNREEIIIELNNLQADIDTEFGHVQADRILCDLLRELGYGDIVDEYEKIERWYA